MTRAKAWLFGLIVLCAAGPAAAAVALRATSVTVAEPGDLGNICVVLDSGGASVAGTQNDLVWDGSCATLSSAADCQVNADIDRDLFGALGPHGSDFTYRALVLSLENLDPLPDGILYCCAFTVETEPGQCCSISVINTGASNPSGRLLSTFSSGGHACVSGGPNTRVPTPTATPLPGSTTHDDDGCQVGPPSPRAPSALLALGAALWLAARRRRARGRD